MQAGPLTIELGPIELRRARLFYADDGAALRVTAQGLSGSARPGRQATSVTIAADEITLEARHGKDSVGALTAEVRIAPTAIEIRELAGTWEKRRVTLAGAVRGPFDAPTLDLAGRGEVDLAIAGPASRRGLAAGGRGPGHRAPEGPGDRAHRDGKRLDR